MIYVLYNMHLWFRLTASEVSQFTKVFTEIRDISFVEENQTYYVLGKKCILLKLS